MVVGQQSPRPADWKLHRLRQLTQDPKLPQSPQLQAEGIVLLCQLWDQLPDADDARAHEAPGEARQAYFSHFRRHVPRFLELDNPLAQYELFGELRQLLPNEAEIRRSLLCLEENQRPYLWAEGEEIYSHCTGLLREYLDYAKYNFAPLGFHFWSAVTALGAICQRRVYFDAGQFYIHPNWYTFLAGDSGTAKSTAAEAAIDLIHRVNRLTAPNLFHESPELQQVARLTYGDRIVNVLPGDMTAPALIESLAQLEYHPDAANYLREKQRLEEELEQRRAAAGGSSGSDDNDSSSSGGSERERLARLSPRAKASLAKPRKADATGIMFIDEMSTFLGKDQYNVAQRAPLLAAIYNADWYEKRTRKRGTEKLLNLAVSFIACCAPSWLVDVISVTVLGGGLGDRTLYVYRQPAFPRVRASSPFQTRDQPRDPVRALRLAKLLHPVVQSNLRHDVVFSAAAREVGEDQYQALVRQMELRYETSGSTDGWTTAQRGFNNVMRLAMMMALSDALYEDQWPRVTVSQSNMELAFAMVQVEENSLQQMVARASSQSFSLVSSRFDDAWGAVQCCTPRGDLMRASGLRRQRRSFTEEVKARIIEGTLEVVQKGRHYRLRHTGKQCDACARHAPKDAGEVSWLR